jgi:glycine cleavage system H protein
MNSTSKHFYTEHHLWITADKDGTYLAGITDHAQQLLGDIVYVEPPLPGSKILAGQVCGIVESVKTASDLHAPVSGEVVAVNDIVTERPELLNDSAETTWIFRFKINEPRDIDKLMESADYQKTLE